MAPVTWWQTNRRPMVPTGTNLLGLVKHVAGVEFGYFGDTFGRPYDEPLPEFDPDEPNADMWATADESREQIIGLYHRAWRHSDATINALPLDAIGHVPWWPADQNEVTLHHVVVRLVIGPGGRATGASWKAWRGRQVTTRRATRKFSDFADRTQPVAPRLRITHRVPFRDQTA